MDTKLLKALFVLVLFPILIFGQMPSTPNTPYSVRWYQISQNGSSLGNSQDSIYSQFAINQKVSSLSTQWINHADGIYYSALRIGIGSNPDKVYRLAITGGSNTYGIRQTGLTLIQNQYYLSSGVKTWQEKFDATNYYFGMDSKDIININTNSLANTITTTSTGVGIKKANPAYDLDVNGNTRTSGSLIIGTTTLGNSVDDKFLVRRSATGLTYFLTLDTIYYHNPDSTRWWDNGNYLYPKDLSWSVGIGTNTPEQALHIVGGTDTYAKTSANGTTAVSGFMFNNTDQNWSVRVRGDINDQFEIFDNTNTKIAISVDKNSPSYSLAIKSDSSVRMYDLIVFDSITAANLPTSNYNSKVVTTDDYGNFHIGTSISAINDSTRFYFDFNCGTFSGSGFYFHEDTIFIDTCFLKEINPTDTNLWYVLNDTIFNKPHYKVEINDYFEVNDHAYFNGGSPDIDNDSLVFGSDLDLLLNSIGIPDSIKAKEKFAKYDIDGNGEFNYTDIYVVTKIYPLLFQPEKYDSLKLIYKVLSGKFGLIEDNRYIFDYNVDINNQFRVRDPDPWGFGNAAKVKWGNGEGIWMGYDNSSNPLEIYSDQNIKFNTGSSILLDGAMSPETDLYYSLGKFDHRWRTFFSQNISDYQDSLLINIPFEDHDTIVSIHKGRLFKSLASIGGGDTCHWYKEYGGEYDVLKNKIGSPDDVVEIAGAGLISNWITSNFITSSSATPLNITAYGDSLRFYGYGIYSYPEYNAAPEIYKFDTALNFTPDEHTYKTDYSFGLRMTTLSGKMVFDAGNRRIHFNTDTLRFNIPILAETPDYILGWSNSTKNVIPISGLPVMPGDLGLDDLNDVTLTNPDSGDGLRLDDETQQWINFPMMSTFAPLADTSLFDKVGNWISPKSSQDWLLIGLGVVENNAEPLAPLHVNGDALITGALDVNEINLETIFNITPQTDSTDVDGQIFFNLNNILKWYANGRWRIFADYDSVNSLIEQAALTTYFDPDSSVITNGTSSSGNVNSLDFHDGVYWEITEQTGSPGIDIQAKFDSVTATPTRLIFSGYYTGLTDEVAIQLYNYTDAGWETYGTISSSSDQRLEYTITDPEEHISNEFMKVRFYHSDAGNPSHKLYIDFLTLSAQGIGGSSGGDNLGNGIATSDIDANGYNINDANTITTTDISLKGNISIDPTPNSDHTFNGFSIEFTAGETLALYDLVYLKFSDGKLWKADGDAVATMPVLYMAAEAINADATGTFIQYGSYVRDDSWDWSSGYIYVSTTTGALTQTKPTGSLDVVQIAGIAMTGDIMYFQPQLITVVNR